MAYSNTDFHMSTFFLFWGLLKLQKTKVFKAYLTRILFKEMD